jgi:hypothetical protein
MKFVAMVCVVLAMSCSAEGAIFGRHVVAKSKVVTRSAVGTCGIGRSCGVAGVRVRSSCTVVGGVLRCSP